MAAIAEAVKRMERAGYRLDVDGGKLVVSGEKPLTPAQQSWLRQHKPELLDYLAADVVDVNTTPALPPPPSYATRIRCLDCRYSDEPADTRRGLTPEHRKPPPAAEDAPQAILGGVTARASGIKMNDDELIFELPDWELSASEIEELERFLAMDLTPPDFDDEELERFLAMDLTPPDFDDEELERFLARCEL